MAAIYNLEFTSADMEMSIYVNGKLRATKFADHGLRVNSKYQFYVEKGQPVHLTIVLLAHHKVLLGNCQDNFRVSFTLHRIGAKRPVAMIHDSWKLKTSQSVKMKEYSFVLK